MSKKCLSFLNESFLFQNKYIDSGFSNYNDDELRNELQRYRDFVLANYDEIKKEIQNESNNLNVSVETFNKLPNTDLYKQLVLYIDQVVIPDPLFKLTDVHTPFHDGISRLIGVKKNKNFERKRLVDAIIYIKRISLLVNQNFVVMLPISLMHEEPKEIPLKYSPTAFADVLPINILEYYRSIANVVNTEKDETGLIMNFNKPLIPGTEIYVRFPDDERITGSGYLYVTSKHLGYDEKSGHAQIGFRTAEDISEEEFNCWVNQSINQAAIHHFASKYKELVFAKKNGCMYLSQSSLTSNILKKAIEQPTKDEELASMAMQLELPLLNQLPIYDILNIRQNYGEAFHNFRTELNSKLLSVADIDDGEALRKQLETISYELNCLQVKEVQKEYRKIVRKLKLDAIACTGSLISTFAMGGITAVGAATAFVKGVADINKYFTDVHEHNGFFLWKLNKQAQKYSV